MKGNINSTSTYDDYAWAFFQRRDAERAEQESQSHYDIDTSNEFVRDDSGNSPGNISEQYTDNDYSLFDNYTHGGDADNAGYVADDDDTEYNIPELKKQFYTFFKNKGYNDNFIAAMAAIADAESGFKWNRYNKAELEKYGDKIAGYGLYQWSNDRNGGNVPKDFLQQLEYALQEINSRKYLVDWMNKNPNASLQDYVNQLTRGFLWGGDNFTLIKTIEDGYNNAYRNLGYDRTYNFQQDIENKTARGNEFLKIINNG